MELKFVELIKPGTAHDFVKYRRIAVTMSIVVNVLILLGATVWPGLNYGVDFAGGTELEIRSRGQPMTRRAARGDQQARLRRADRAAGRLPPKSTTSSSASSASRS